MEDLKYRHQGTRATLMIGSLYVKVSKLRATKDSL